MLKSTNSVETYIHHNEVFIFFYRNVLIINLISI